MLPLGGIGESKSLNTPILDTLWLWGQFGDFVELKGWVWPLFVELKEHGFDHWHYGKDGDVGVPDPVSLTADNCEKGCDQIVTKSQSHRAIVNEQVQLVRRGRLYADYIVHCFNMNLSTMHYDVRVKRCIRLYIADHRYYFLAWYDDIAEVQLVL